MPLPQTPNPTGRARYDITNYKIDAELRPAEHILRATADVTFTPLDTTRSVVFELNGSLKVEGIERNGRALTNFVQDQVGVDQIGPSVRVDLDEVVPPVSRSLYASAIMARCSRPKAGRSPRSDWLTSGKKVLT